MCGCGCNDFGTSLHRMMNDGNARNRFLRSMAPYSNMSHRDLLRHIRSLSCEVPVEERQRHLACLDSLCRDGRFQSQEMRKRVGLLRDTLNADPPDPPRRIRRRRFGGLLGSLILLALLI